MTTSTLWRSYLKPEESSRVAELDAIIDAHRSASIKLTAEREIIRRRAVGRIRLAAQKDAG